MREAFAEAQRDQATERPLYEPFRWLVEGWSDELRGLSHTSPLRGFPSPSFLGRVEIDVDSVTGDPLGGVKVSGRVKTGYRTLREIREAKPR